MPLKRSSATSMKRTRCRFRLQLDLRPQLQLPLVRLPVPPVPNLISISPFEAVGKSGQLSDEYFVRLSLGLMPEEKKEDKKKTGEVGPSGDFWPLRRCLDNETRLAY